MRISKNDWMVFMVMAVALVISVFPVGVMAGGEPGAGCGLDDLKYDPAPYIGTITLEWIGLDGIGDVYAQGFVEQKGNTGCTGTFSGVIVEDIPFDTFKSWKSNDLRLTCLENLCDPVTGNCPFPCHGDGASFEVVGVGQITMLTEYSFSAKFIIMHLE